MQRSASDHAAVSEVPPIVHEVLRSPGQPLGPETRAFMEPHFGYDFSHVRVHTDDKAAESAQAVNALAYTVGRDVVFGAGRYTAGTRRGQQLLAHELAHVVQQGPSADAASGLMINSPGDTFEQDAERTAGQITAGAQSASPLSTFTGGLRLQRQPAKEETEVPLPAGSLATFKLDKQGKIRKWDMDQIAKKVFQALSASKTAYIQVNGYYPKGDTDFDPTVPIENAKKALVQWIGKSKIPDIESRIVTYYGAGGPYSKDVGGEVEIELFYSSQGPSGGLGSGPPPKYPAKEAGKGAGGERRAPKKKGECWIQWGDYCVDVQVEVETPIGKPPSLRDIQEGVEKISPPKKETVPGAADCDKFQTFHFSATNTEYLGQCCKGTLNKETKKIEKGAEGKTECCPPERIAITPTGERCCAEGEKVVEGKCVNVPKDVPEKEPAGTVSIPRSVTGKLMTGTLTLSPDFLSSAGSTTIDGFGLDNPTLTGEADPGNPKKDYYPNRLALLDEAAKTLVILLKMAPGATVEITGHADATGKEERNIPLAQQRADFVRTQLILAGVPADVIQTHNAGSSQPVVKTKKPEPQNRRVEIRFKTSLQPTVPPAPQTSPLMPAPRLTWPGQGEKP